MKRSIGKILLLIAGIFVVAWGVVGLFNVLEMIFVTDSTVFADTEAIINTVWNLVFNCLQIIGGALAIIAFATSSKGVANIVFIYAIFFLISVVLNVIQFVYALPSVSVEGLPYKIIELCVTIIIPLFYSVGGIYYHKGKKA